MNSSFLNLQSYICFWANLDQKSQSCPFWLKIGTNCISWMLILIPTLVFWIWKPKFIFGQVWAKKVKVVFFVWKLACIVSRGYWFLFQNQFSKFQNLTLFMGRVRPKKVELPALFDIVTHSISWVLICFIWNLTGEDKKERF